MSRVLASLLIAGLSLASLTPTSSFGEPLPEFSVNTWGPYSTGLWNHSFLPTSRVTHGIVYDGDLFVGGSFTRAGLSEPVAGHAAYDGADWNPFPDGNLTLPFAEYQGDLFAGKYRWDGATAVDVGVSYTPQIMYSDATQLVSAGYNASGRVVREWSDQISAWVTVPGVFEDDGTQTPTFFAIHPWQDGWVVTGQNLDSVGGLPIAGAAYWDGVQWTNYGPIEGLIGYALAVYQGVLLMGTTAGLYSWNGSSWQPWGGVPQFNDIYALTVVGSDLYVGGHFTQAGGIPVSNVARFDGLQWHDLDGGIDGDSVWTIVADGNRIYVGGNFAGAGGRNASNLAYWDGMHWHRTGPAGLGVGGGGATVRDWAVYGGDVIIAGGIHGWGVETLNNVARLEDDHWLPLGEGLNDEVLDVVALGNDLIAVGPFTASGASPMVEVARFDGNNWNPMISSINGEVRTTSVVNGELYIGGAFFNIDGTPIASVARHDGNAWQPVGLGTQAGVETLVEFEGDLIAGGSFIFASGAFVSNVARWDGAQWSILGDGLSFKVNTLEVVDGTLYAGGEFTHTGGNLVNRIARWDGNAWQSLAGGVNGHVHDIVQWGTNIYVVGDFTQADGMPAAGIAAWDPQLQNWLDLGYGLYTDPTPPEPRSGTSLLALDATLYVGGSFGSVYENANSFVHAAGIAILNDPTIVAAPAAPGRAMLRLTAKPNPFNPRTILDFEMSTAGVVLVDVYDIRGRKVVNLIEEFRPAGPHRLAWNGTDGDGTTVSSGVYFVRLRDETQSVTQKVVLTK